MDYTRSKRRTLTLVAALWPWVATSACFGPGDTTGGVEDDDLVLVGTIVASTATTGTSPDPDGYVVRLDESRVQPIDVNGSVTFGDLRVGGWSVTLDGYASNCVIAGVNPVMLQLFADSIVSVQFDLTCN